MLLDELNKFTYSTYRNLLEHLKTRWTFLKFLDAYETMPNYPYIMLRHDLDSFPETALNMALIENQYDIKSTYFFSCCSPLYNVHDPRVTELILELSTLGHDIGLHYDSGLYEKYSRTIKNGLETDACFLSEIIGSDIRVMSCHNPHKRKPIKSSTLIEVYEDIPFDIYASDSCREWTENILLSFPSNPKTIHLLIHPPLWSEQLMSKNEIFERIFYGANERIRIEKEVWKEMWSNR